MTHQFVAELIGKDFVKVWILIFQLFVVNENIHVQPVPTHFYKISSWTLPTATMSTSRFHDL
jgi:hypothetical protein